MRPDVALPVAVYNALNNAPFNAGMTDIRPEDALFATNRALAPLTPGRSGLGYGPPPIGVPIQSAFSTKTAVPVLFALSGTDPISGLPITFNYATSSVGASPVVVFVNSTMTGSGHLGNSTFTNVPRFVLAFAQNGALSITRDLMNKTGLPQIGLHTLLREPLSGTYNTMEFNVARSVEVGSSQENNVTPPGDNPLNQSYGTGGSRQRVVGTGEMVSEVSTIADSLGYAFWGFGNFAGVIGTTKYVTVDGVDPIRQTYTNGLFPTCTSPPCVGALTFPNIKNGSYPIWSVLRIVTVSPVPSGIQALYNAALTEATQIPDFVPATQLNVFRSHYTQIVAASNGIIAGHPESGGDMGGAVFTVQADKDYFTQTGVEILQRKQ
jgi:ABC-type phosphate transport system substrate-binding protein